MKKTLLFIFLFLVTFGLFIRVGTQKAHAASPIKTVFIILMENQDWSAVKGSASPYITTTLLPMGAHAENYRNGGVHPSAPNYVTLEAGSPIVGTGDCKPTDSGCSTSANHLSKLLDGAGIPWKEYAEDTNGTSCILNFSGTDVNHVPFSYFTDVTNNNNPNSANCIAHERPYTELAGNLQNNTVARYNFITPNLDHNMHNGTIQQADTWLSQQVPMIMNSQAYKNGGLIIITWDEDSGSNNPIGMIVLSQYAKKNYSNTIAYSHGSTLRTLEEIFGVSPMLGSAASATDLSDLFTVPLTGSTQPVPTSPASPTVLVPTNFCLGSCPTTAPTNGPGNNPSQGPSSSVPSGTTISSAPSPTPCTTGESVSIKSEKEKRRARRNGAIGNFFLQLLQLLIALLQQLLGGSITIPPIGTPTPGTSPVPGTSPMPSGTPCGSPSTTISTSPSSTPSTVPSAAPSANPTTSTSTLGPKTSLHYTANGNFSGNTYTPSAARFNVADVGSVGQVNNLPLGVKALVDINSCAGTTSSFTGSIQPYIGNAKVFGFFLIDEPDPTGKYKTLCPASNLKAESDWIHQHDSGAKTFIVVMNMSSSKTPTYMNTYNPANTDIDYFGIDAYPCRTDYNGCDFTIVNRNITAATTAGIPIAKIVPVYQAFGGGNYTTDGGGKYVMPTASQETQLLNTWASIVPNPGFDYAYSWGVQNGDQALSGSTALQQIFSAHNK